MYQCGLLFLVCRPARASTLLANFGSYLKRINEHVANTLYISLESPNFTSTHKPPASSRMTTTELIKLIPALYVEAHRAVPSLDVRVLHHHHYHQQAEQDVRRRFKVRPLVYLTNEVVETKQLVNAVTSNFDLPSRPVMVVEAQLDAEQTNSSPQTNNLQSLDVSTTCYDNVCLGGTFDNLHNGHKVLLSLAQLKCHQILTVGVTDMSMVRHKTLWELIESPEKRISNLWTYLVDVDPYIDYRLEKIADPFGPAIVDRSLEAIVVSEETVRGGEKINQIRAEKGMSLLKVDVIKMLDDTHREHNVEETKVSSSSLRLRKLGTLLKEPEPRPALPPKPYLIGLTGLVASGKSSIANKLRELGAAVINVDQLGHKTYSKPDQPAYQAILAEFGNSVLEESGDIDRRKLGALVFENEDKLARLNAIVWPHVADLVAEEVARATAANYSVIVLEIALLIEAGWQDKVHQVWLTLLDEKEAVKRLQRRNQLSEAEAIKRVSTMLSGHEKVPEANVVFCTFWAEDFTWTQVRRAWAMLQNRGYVDKKDVSN